MAVLTWVGQSGLVQGLLLGAVLAFLTAVVVLDAVARRITTTVDGWSSIRVCGRPENGILVRAACAKALPAVNSFEEAAYWRATKDGSGRRLTGGHDYVLRFPERGLPPNGAFWSLTLTDRTGYMVPDSSGRSSVDDRSGLIREADGSFELHLSRTAPAGREANWMPTPRGAFSLMLRAYLPGAAVLDGSYHVPPIVRAD